MKNQVLRQRSRANFISCGIWSSRSLSLRNGDEYSWWNGHPWYLSQMEKSVVVHNIRKLHCKGKQILWVSRAEIPSDVVDPNATSFATLLCTPSGNSVTKMQNPQEIYGKSAKLAQIKHFTVSWDSKFAPQMCQGLRFRIAMRNRNWFYGG